VTPEHITEGIRTAIHRLEETAKILEQLEERFEQGKATAAEFKAAWEDHERAKIEAAKAHRAWRAADAERQRQAIAEANR
jgi:hypothetical protein